MPALMLITRDNYGITIARKKGRKEGE